MSCASCTYRSESARSPRRVVVAVPPPYHYLQYPTGCARDSSLPVPAPLFLAWPLTASKASFPRPIYVESSSTCPSILHFVIRPTTQRSTYPCPHRIHRLLRPAPTTLIVLSCGGAVPAVALRPAHSQALLLPFQIIFGGWDHPQLDERIYVTGFAVNLLLRTRCNRPQPGAPSEAGSRPFESAVVQV